MLDISFQWCVGQFWGLCVWWLVGHFPLFGGAPSTGATNHHQHQQGPAGDRSRCSGREAFNRNAAPLEETLRKVVLAAGRLAQLAGAAAGLWWHCTRSSTWWESPREGVVVVVPRPGVSWAGRQDCDRPTGRCRRWWWAVGMHATSTQQSPAIDAAGRWHYLVATSAVAWAAHGQGQ